jgi:hypothetical protein
VLDVDVVVDGPVVMLELSRDIEVVASDSVMVVVVGVWVPGALHAATTRATAPTSAETLTFTAAVRAGRRRFAIFSAIGSR